MHRGAALVGERDGRDRSLSAVVGSRRFASCNILGLFPDSEGVMHAPELTVSRASELLSAGGSNSGGHADVCRPFVSSSNTERTADVARVRLRVAC